MSTEVANQELSIIEKSVEIFKQGGPVLLANQQRSAKAVIVGQNILNAIREKGMTPELDERAMNYLVNCSKALKEENENRQAITQLMDEIKKMFTAAEAQIDVKKEGTYPNLIQAERNNYAKQVAEEKKRKEEEARIAAEKAKELIDVKGDIEIKMFQYYSDFLASAKTKLLNNFNSLTLETISAAKDSLETWQPDYPADHLNLFKLGNYSKHLTTEEFNELIKNNANAKYKDYRNNYIAEMNLHKQEVIDRIPSKIAELQEAADRAARLKKEQEEAAERERKRKEQIAAANEAERKRLQAIADKEKEEQEKRLAAIAEEQRKADEEKKKREEEEARKIAQEQEDARKVVEMDVAVNKEGEKTLVLFEQESASATDEKAPETRTGFDIEVTHQAGYVQLFTLWFEQEGKNLPLDKIDKTSFGQIRAWAEKLAHKTGEKIESKFLVYKDSYKAVNRKAKA